MRKLIPWLVGLGLLLGLIWIGRPLLTRAQVDISGNSEDKAFVARALAEWLVTGSDADQVFGGLGGIKAQPFSLRTDSAISGSPATSSFFFGSVNPTENNSFDLGTPSSSWRNVYASGTITMAGGAGTSTFVNLAVTGNTRLGDATGDLIDITGRISTTINPNVNNTLDLGAFGTAWRDLYASGTARIGVVDGYAGTSTFSALAVDTSDFVVASGTGRVGIGTATPSRLLTLAAAGSDNASQNFIIDGIAHGITDELPTTDSYGYFRDANGADGGLQIVGSSDAAGTTGLTFFGILGVVDPTDSVPAVRFEGSKKSGTTRTAVGSLETAFEFRTGASTVLLTIPGSGNVNPGTNNTQDLGSFGTAWRDIYSSGSIRLGDGGTGASSTWSSMGTSYPLAGFV